MTAEELIDIWHSDPKNKYLGAKKSAIKFAEYYYQEKVKSALAPVRCSCSKLSGNTGAP